MDPLLLTALVCLAAYLVGGVPFGYLVARARGVDILHQGSGNIGATNVGRVLGRRFGLLVFALDFAKGALPTAAALAAAPFADPGWGPATPQVLGVAAGLAAFLGHVFPPYLRFHGGKGVATGAGVVAVLLPAPALGAVLVWLAVLCAARYVSLASTTAALALCLFHLALAPAPLAPAGLPLTLFCVVAAGLVLLRHRANLARLVKGNENQLRDSPTMQTLTKTVHVLALGLWFGTAVFFTFVVGLSLFGSFEALGERPAAERPAWFPLPPEFRRHDPDLDGPREQGTRAAGFAVSPMFPWYFLIQGACGLLALGTALGLSRSHPGRVHRLRGNLLLAALLLVLAGWAVERRVNELRGPRYLTADAFLQSSPDQAEALKQAALDARAEFGRVHGLSLLLNFATLALVTVGMALAARLPEGVAGPAPAGGPKVLPPEAGNTPVPVHEVMPPA
jgi:acyl-phosphate glycerol 3-phosphate acyltransferase